MKRLLVVTLLVAFAGLAISQFEDEHPDMPFSFSDDENGEYEVAEDMPADDVNASDEGNKWEKPWFCREHDCPKFELKKKTSEFEIRTYQESRWVTNMVKHEEDLPVAFSRLYKYIRGKNKDKKKLDMTVPVLVKVMPCSSMSDESVDEVDEVFGEGKCCHRFNVSFYVPNKFQGDRKPPMPLEEKLTIKKMPSCTVAVRPFPGWATKKMIVRELKNLKTMLDKERIEYDMKEGFGFAAYDPPHRSQHRHNEVWIHIKKSPSDEATNFVF